MKLVGIYLFGLRIAVEMVVGWWDGGMTVTTRGGG